MRSLLARVVVVAAALVAVAAPAAHADSIAYIKDGNVWLSTSDGARQFQVTFTGAYADVSQADDGTMIALSGVRLHKLDRLGNVVADFDTPVSDTRPAPEKTFYGPFDPAISPDGAKVAYTYHYMTQSQSPTCYPPTCFVGINEGGTGYSHSDRQTGWDEAGLTKHSGWRNPVWVDNNVTILSDPTHLPNADVVVDEPGAREGHGFMAKNWFTDDAEGNPHTGAGDIARDRTKMAFLTGENDSTLTFYAVSQFPTTFPDGEAPVDTRPGICYRYSGPNGGRYGTPTFSPDGAKAAFTEGDGIHYVDVPSFGGGCTTTGASPNTKLLIPGGQQPDWGPADVPASRPEVKPDPKKNDDKNGPKKNDDGGDTKPASVKVSKAKLGAALAKGLKVRLTGLPAGKAKIVVKQAGTVVGKATATVGSDRTATARVKFTKFAKRALRGMKRVTLTVSAGGASTKLTLRR